MMPFACRFKDGAFHPVPYFKDEIAKSFEDGHLYRLEEVKERSQASHAHYFASVHDGWQSLPENMIERFPSADHLRKWCLIRAGFSHSRSIACDSPEEARKVAAFVQPFDEFAVVSVGGTVVTVFTAMSQSYKDMGKVEFAKSKDAVLELIASMIGTDRQTLESNAGAAA